ncbi:MAG: hypothetical protein KAT28_00450 [Candidatus Aenigmarchaeota archaeon]|nr:hypothetical protein [Candidatus Aenigmarchaeota archaeon]
MGKWYEDLKEKLLDVCEPERTWKEYDWKEGLQELPKLAPKSRRCVFGILTEDFLEELLNGETRGALKDNYDDYISEDGKSSYLPSPTKILNALYVPANIFLFDNAELPENYKKELTELKKDISNSYFLIKKGGPDILDGSEFYSVGTDFALFDYLGHNKNNSGSAWCSNKKTNKVLIIKDNDLFKHFLVEDTVVESYRI